MGELVRDDRLELGGLEELEQPAGHVQARAAAPQPDEPRVRLALVLDDDLGAGQVGQDAEPVDDPVQHGLVLGPDDARLGPLGPLAHRPDDPDQRGDRDADEDLVRRDDHHGHEAGQDQQRGADRGEHHPRLQSPVGREELAAAPATGHVRRLARD